MNPLVLFAFLAIFLLAGACEHEQVQQDVERDENYVTLGHFYGECVGEECVEIFKITEAGIYEDQKDNYPNGLYEGKWKQIEKEIAFIPEDIKQLIPDTMYHQTNKTFGNPDVVDQGGLYLEVEYRGERVYWYIDQIDSNIPGYVVPIHEKINQIVGKLD